MEREPSVRTVETEPIVGVIQIEVCSEQEMRAPAEVPAQAKTQARIVEAEHADAGYVVVLDDIPVQEIEAQIGAEAARRPIGERGAARPGAGPARTAVASLADA